MKSKEARVQKVQYRRKREGKTNYKQRLKLLKSGRARLVVRPSIKSMSCQIILFDTKGDKVVASANGNELEKFGWKYSKGSIPAAYLTGVLLGTKAKKDIKDAILDTGLIGLTKGNRIFACMKGVVDAGVEIPHSEDILPTEERLNGKHIADYAIKIKDNKESYEKQFSSYIKNNQDPTQIAKVFEDVKKKIMAGEK